MRQTDKSKLMGKTQMWELTLKQIQLYPFIETIFITAFYTIKVSSVAVDTQKSQNKISREESFNVSNVKKIHSLLTSG